jgi:hypothetical protein
MMAFPARVSTSNLNNYSNLTLCYNSTSDVCRGQTVMYGIPFSQVDRSNDFVARIVDCSVLLRSANTMTLFVPLIFYLPQQNI